MVSVEREARVNHRQKCCSRMVWFSCAALVALVLDQLSKWWVRTRLPVPGDEVSALPGWFHFEHVQNRGAAWGMFEGQKWMLVFFTLTVTVAVLASAKDIAARGKMAAIGFGFILGGALGNLIDRLYQSYVTDFIDLDTPVHFLRTFPVFNIADSALTVGVVLLVLTMLRPSRFAAVSSDVPGDRSAQTEVPVAKP